MNLYRVKWSDDAINGDDDTDDPDHHDNDNAVEVCRAVAAR